MDELRLVTDFDRSLIEVGPPRAMLSRWLTSWFSQDITTWGTFQDLLISSESRKIERDMEKAFYDKEREGTLKVEEAEDWWSTSMALHVGNRTNISDIENACKRIGMRPRAGVQGMSQLIDSLHVPWVIFSAGEKHVIDWVVKEYGLKPSKVLATELITNVVGKVIDWDSGSIIHSLNKHESEHPELMAIRARRKNAIVVGDDEQDPWMVDGDNAIRLQVVRKGRRPSRGDRKASIAAGYDGMVRSFEPITHIIGRIAAGHKSDWRNSKAS